MKYVELNNTRVPYILLYKKNKHTYFYFKQDGHIKIHANPTFKESELLIHMKKNAATFLLKREKAMNAIRKEDPIYYYLWGKKLLKKYDSNIKQITLEENAIIFPELDTDQLVILVRKFEKKQVLLKMEELTRKYENNPYINLSNITLKTRYTKTRFGSCNSVKRNINLNTKLVHYEIRFIEYVFLHEITHLNVTNHSSKFYTLLEKLCPNYKELRYELRQLFRN